MNERLLELAFLCLGITASIYGVVRRNPSMRFVMFCNIPMMTWAIGTFAGTFLAILLGSGVNPQSSGLFHTAAIVAEIGLCEYGVKLALKQRQSQIAEWLSRKELKFKSSKFYEYPVDRILYRLNQKGEDSV